jgi:inosine-uridine nucleoside N-ribohydrolase
VKWCLTWYSDFVAEMVVVESKKSQVLHLTTWQGNAPFNHEDSHLIFLVFCDIIALTFLV